MFWFVLEDGSGIDVATDASWHVGGGTRKEKGPALVLLGQLAQLLQVQHLAEGHAPEREDVLVQVVRLGGRPALEAGRVPSHGGEVAVVEPVLHGLLLLDPRPRLLAAVGAVAAQGEGVAFLGRPVVVVLHPAGADEEDVADLDVAALRGRTDVDALPLPARRQLVVRYRMARRRVVLDPVGVGVRAVVEQDAAAGEAVRAPVVDATFVVGRLADNVGRVSVVVESFCSINDHNV